MGAQGAEGVFFGYNRSSSTFVVGLADGSWVETRSVTRTPMNERWVNEKLASITARPGERRERVARPRVRFENAALGQEETAVEAPPHPGRRMRVSKAVWKSTAMTTNALSASIFKNTAQGRLVVSTLNNAVLGS